MESSKVLNLASLRAAKMGVFNPSLVKGVLGQPVLIRCGCPWFCACLKPSVKTIELFQVVWKAGCPFPQI